MRIHTIVQREREQMRCRALLMDLWCSKTAVKCCVFTREFGFLAPSTNLALSLSACTYVTMVTVMVISAFRPDLSNLIGPIDSPPLALRNHLTPMALSIHLHFSIGKFCLELHSCLALQFKGKEGQSAVRLDC